jgi:hypothetical protein
MGRIKYYYFSTKPRPRHAHSGRAMAGRSYTRGGNPTGRSLRYSPWAKALQIDAAEGLNLGHPDSIAPAERASLKKAASRPPTGNRVDSAHCPAAVSAYTQLVERRVVAAANEALREGRVELPRGIKSASVEGKWVPEAAAQRLRLGWACALLLEHMGSFWQHRAGLQAQQEGREQGHRLRRAHPVPPSAPPSPSPSLTPAPRPQDCRTRGLRRVPARRVQGRPPDRVLR